MTHAFQVERFRSYAKKSYSGNVEIAEPDF
jgi:hypothetical protein